MVLVVLELAMQTQMTTNVQMSALAHLHVQLLCPFLSTLREDVLTAQSL